MAAKPKETKAKVIKEKKPLHPDVTFKKGRNTKGLWGGALAMFPKLKVNMAKGTKTYWARVEEHLMTYQPNNKQGITKARKMQLRLS